MVVGKKWFVAGHHCSIDFIDTYRDLFSKPPLEKTNQQERVKNKNSHLLHARGGQRLGCWGIHNLATKQKRYNIRCSKNP